MKGDIDEHYGKILLMIILIIVICGIYLFLIRPQQEFIEKTENFAKSRDRFLHQFCKNMKTDNYKIIEIYKYNFYCYKEIGNARTVIYGTYDYEYKNGDYRFFVLNEV